MKELDLAIKAAKAAGKVHLKYFGKVASKNKNANPRDLVTIADTEAEKVILALIRKHFPMHQILSEEAGNQGSSDAFWIVDPLDGTSNFFRKQNDFCVLIAFAKKGVLQFGVTWFPITKELYVGVKGKGATRNGKSIRVSAEAKLATMFACTQMTSNSEYRKKNLVLYSGVLLQVRNIHVFSACIARGLADVAEGKVDFLFRSGAHYWDFAAGNLLVQEAGGVATDLSGKDFNIKSNGALVSNGKIHAELVKTLSASVRTKK